MKKIIALIAFLVVQTIVTDTVEAQQSRQQSTRRARPGQSAQIRPASGTQQPANRPVVKQASHYDSIIEGEVIVDGGYVEDFHGGCDSCGDSGCDSCSLGAGYCNTCSSPNRFCICFPSHGWVQAEYLSWTQDGMRIPALVTTSTAGTPRAQAGVLGQTATSTLFGNQEILDDDQSGFRIRFGWWLSSFPGWGIEGEYAGLEEQTESFFSVSGGSPTLARPFFNILTGAEDAELVAYTDPAGNVIVAGNVMVNASSQFEGAAVRLRRQLCGSNGCGYSYLCNQTVPTSSRLDATIGYRFWELDEALSISESLTSTDGNFAINDSFDTRNQFNGVELGVLWQGRRGSFSLDALMRLGIGNMHQTATIAGSTMITENGTTDSFATGILAQRTNIGTYDQDKFTMIPELGLTLGYQWTKRIRLTAGYSAIYMGNVIRPGDQIDLDVNPNLFAPELTPFTGALRPQFDFVETDYLVQGLSFGGEFRW